MAKCKDLLCDKTKQKTQVFMKLKTDILTKKFLKKINFLQEVFSLEHLNTSTADEMYSRQPFVILLCLNPLVQKLLSLGPTFAHKNIAIKIV